MLQYLLAPKQKSVLWGLISHCIYANEAVNFAWAPVCHIHSEMDDTNTNADISRNLFNDNTSTDSKYCSQQPPSTITYPAQWMFHMHLWSYIT